MKVVTLVCHDCGHEEKINSYSLDEAKRLRIPPKKLRCSKCGSENVEVFE